MMTDNSFEIFISYAREDEIYVKKLQAHLSALRRQGYITIRDDRDIHLGNNWKDEIDKAVSAAKIIILVISVDFMKSDYCYAEMNYALERHKQGGTYVIPIILHPTRWENTPLAQIDILPRSHVPVVAFSDPEEALCNIAKELRHIVENWLINKWRDEGNELYRQGKYDEALLLYEKILHLKNSLAASVDMGNTLIDLEEYEEALRVYDAYATVSLIDDRSSWETKNNIDEYRFGKTFFEQALHEYEQAIQQSAPHSSTFSWVGMRREDVPTLTVDGYLLVLDRFEQVIQRNPINPFLYHLKGNLLFQLGRYREALGPYEQAIQLQEDFQLQEDLKLSYQYLSEVLEYVSQEVYKKINEFARHDLERANQLRDKHAG